MNTREIGACFFQHYQSTLLKFNSSAYNNSLSTEAQHHFFSTLKKEYPNLNVLIYRLHQDLTSIELQQFVSGFYSQQLLEKHWHHMLKLKNLSIKDLKSFQVDLSDNFARMYY